MAEDLPLDAAGGAREIAGQVRQPPPAALDLQRPRPQRAAAVDGGARDVIAQLGQHARRSVVVVGQLLHLGQPQPQGHPVTGLGAQELLQDLRRLRGLTGPSQHGDQILGGAGAVRGQLPERAANGQLAGGVVGVDQQRQHCFQDRSALARLVSDWQRGFQGGHGAGAITGGFQRRRATDQRRGGAGTQLGGAGERRRRCGGVTTVQLQASGGFDVGVARWQVAGAAFEVGQPAAKVGPPGDRAQARPAGGIVGGGGKCPGRLFQQRAVVVALDRPVGGGRGGRRHGDDHGDRQQRRQRRTNNQAHATRLASKITTPEPRTIAGSGADRGVSGWCGY